MENISFYLEKYASLGLKEKKTKELLRESIQEACKIKVEDSEMDISGGIMRINLSGAPKAEIFIKKEKIKEIFDKKMEEGSLKKVERRIL